ncbi:Leader peptidase PppA [Shimia sp. SK013]|uniref:prepilin peptidase n=1 Tax=Shimia sp. SK013 TaxID=1389006 RepID=UPI0006B62BF0|nr:A24 family peptidase [Shimia sp. SK013]KPA19794.1 Leader peptidase PppA [Shimia sp. SK013]
MFQTDATLIDEITIAVLLIVLSPAVGSFLAVLVDRLPRGEDVMMARSRCRSCEKALTWRDLVPVASFVVNRGRCRHCGAKVPQWLLAMEVAALGLAGLGVALWPYGWPVSVLVVDVALLWVLLALFAADLRWMRLPDVLTGALLGVALLRALLVPSGDPLQALLGAGLGVLSFAILRWAYWRVRGREGLGLGDVKLMAGLGALSGPIDLPLLVLIAALLALAGAGAARATGRSLVATTALPFGAALALAGGLLWLARMLAL